MSDLVELFFEPTDPGPHLIEVNPEDFRGLDADEIEAALYELVDMHSADCFGSYITDAAHVIEEIREALDALEEED